MSPKEFYIYMVMKWLRLLEYRCALGRGKGYGTATIKQEVRLLSQLLKTPPRLAVDVGANIGDYTATLQQYYPQLEVHLFEPSAVNVKKLTKRFDNDKLIHICPMALSDKAGKATLFADQAGSGMASLTKRRLDHLNVHFDNNEKVKTVRFEDYWRDSLASRPLDIVKLDIEGHELTALQGFGKAIHAVKVLQFEFGGCNIDTRTYFQDFWYFFKEHHFSIYRVTPFGAEAITKYREKDEFFSTTNYIAVRQQS